MKKILLVALALNVSIASAESYTRFGNTVQGSNGISATQYGNTTQFSNGVTANQ